MRNVQCRFLFILLAGLISTGCAHKKLIEAGEDLNRQGRYELAVEQYQKALNLEPGDKKTQQKLEIAREELNIWLDDLHNQADIAKQNGLDGRAMLLYSKVAQIRRDQTALNQYKQLHSELGSQARYKIAITSPKTLGSNLGRSLSDVQVIAKANKNKANQFSVKFSQTSVSIGSKTVLKEGISQYVSGVETVANPDYLHLQDDIAIEREHIHEYSNQYDHYYSDVKDSRRMLTSLQKDREIAQLKLGNAPPNSAEQHRWSKEVERLNAQVSKAERQLTNQQKLLDDVDYKASKAKKLLSEHLNALSYLPPTVEQDILSDYPYQIKEETRTASNRLTAKFNDGSVKSKTVTASDTDEGHRAHPTIELAYNPIKLISDKQLTRKLYRNVAVQAEDAISRHAKTYRDNLRGKANQLTGVDEKLEAWVLYGLSGENGVDSNTARQMQNQLKQEFGIAGEFDINKLLNLFSR